MCTVWADEENGPNPGGLQDGGHTVPEPGTLNHGVGKGKKGKQDDSQPESLPSEWVATSHCCPFPTPHPTPRSDRGVHQQKKEDTAKTWRGGKSVETCDP